jgi:threonine aldolase
MQKTFASDNYSGVHSKIMEALIRANEGHAASYGADEYTSRAIDKFKKIFGGDVGVFFAYNGTGANVLGLKAISLSFQSILCSELAHINVDESTAPELFTGCKIIPLPTQDGKIYPVDIEKKIIRVGDQHHPQARIVSISQTTEYATVYSIAEVKALADLVHSHKMYLHMDGSRLSNAAVSLQADFKEFTFDAGVDVLSFGGTKNGMMFGEAVIFSKASMAEFFPYIRKQGMQLHSKMRFIGAQFEALLTNDLWKESASWSNKMAKRLEVGLRQFPQLKITQEVKANGVFAIFPQDTIPAMQQEFFFYVWNDKTSEVRLMCSFDTTEEEVDKFVNKLGELLKNNE